MERGELDQESLRFDMKSKKVFGSDTSYDLQVVESDVARGLLSPFPIVLPKAQRSSGAPTRWELGGYEFSMSSASSTEPDWVLIHASPVASTAGASTAQRTSVLYSFRSGVRAIRWSSTYLGDRRTVSGELYFCGTGRLMSDTL